MNKLYRKGLIEGQDRIKGIASGKSEEELEALILVLETSLIALKGALTKTRRAKYGVLFGKQIFGSEEKACG